MRVLGIDPGSISTGFGVVDRQGSALKYVCHGNISPGRGLPLTGRLLAISARLREVMEAYRPDAVSIESVFFAKNARSAIVLGQARGAALLTVADCGVPVFEYPPTAIKQAVTGFGLAAKEDVQKMVRLLLKDNGIEGKSDATDALAIAICHLSSSKSLAVMGTSVRLNTRRPV